MGLWERFTETWEESKILRVVLQLLLLIGIIFTGIRFYQVMFKEEVVDEEIVEQEEVYGKISEETIHVLENPKRYEEEDIDKAYQETLTTFDDQFVEEKEYEGGELKEGIYLYHEKVSPHYKEVSRLAKEVSDLGVRVRFYTPQNDQVIAELSGYVNLLNEEGTEMDTEAVIVREGEEEELIKEEGKVLEYLEGVIDANK